MKKTAKTVAIAAAFAALSLSGCKGPIDSANENLVYGPPSDYKVEDSSIIKEDSSNSDDTSTDYSDSSEEDTDQNFRVDQPIQIAYGPPDDSDYSDSSEEDTDQNFRVDQPIQVEYGPPDDSDYSEDDNHYNPENDIPAEVYGPPNF